MNRSEKLLSILEDVLITPKEALQILDISADDANDKTKVKKAYRRASSKHHPDKGGEHEMMLKVQAAYNLLNKGNYSSTGNNFDKSYTNSKEEWERNRNEYRILGERIKNELRDTVDYQAFIDHFNKLSGLDFTYKIVAEFPKPKQRHVYHAGVNIEFIADGGNTVFDMRISSNLTDIKYSSSLGTEQIRYPLSITAYGYHNRKKQKLSQSDWKHTSDHVQLKDPTKIFPTAKLKKIFSGATSKRAFKKRDMFLALKNELGADHDGKEWARIPIGDGSDDYKLTLFRITFMRVGMWQGNGIYKKFGRVTMINGSLPESEETIEILKDIQKKVSKLSGDRLVKTTDKLFTDAYNKQAEKARNG